MVHELDPNILGLVGQLRSTTLGGLLTVTHLQQLIGIYSSFSNE